MNPKYIWNRIQYPASLGTQLLNRDSVIIKLTCVVANEARFPTTWSTGKLYNKHRGRPIHSALGEYVKVLLYLIILITSLLRCPWWILITRVSVMLNLHRSTPISRMIFFTFYSVLSVRLLLFHHTPLLRLPVALQALSTSQLRVPVIGIVGYALSARGCRMTNACQWRIPYSGSQCWSCWELLACDLPVLHRIVSFCAVRGCKRSNVCCHDIMMIHYSTVRNFESSLIDESW